MRCASIGESFPGTGIAHIEWIDGELNRIWSLRGPFPGLGSALKAAGIDSGNLIAYDLALSQRQPALNGQRIRGS